MVKNCSGVWIALVVLPRVHAVSLAKGMFTGAHAVKKVPPRLPVLRLADENRPRADWFWRVRSQTIAERGQCKALVRIFSENANAGKRPKHSVQRARVGSGCDGEVVAALGAVLQKVGDPECRDNIERLRHLESVDQT